MSNKNNYKNVLGLKSSVAAAAASLTEIQLQSKCFQWTWNEYPETRRCFFHVPNGGSRNKIEAGQLKASGVVAGVWDMPFNWKKQLYWFEFKVGANKLSPEQIEFRKAQEAQGAICFDPFYDEDSFKSTFKSIIQC